MALIHLPTHPSTAWVFKPKPKTEARKVGGRAPQAEGAHKKAHHGQGAGKGPSSLGKYPECPVSGCGPQRGQLPHFWFSWEQPGAGRDA